MKQPAFLLLTSLLLAAASAAAQPGPAAGYDDPLVYAQDYAEGQVDDASADPVGYAGSKGSADAAAAETAHAAYIACWTAHYHGDLMPPGCELFFTPPQEGGPLPEEAEQSETEEAAEGVVDSAAEFAEEAQEIIAAIVADPTSAPSQLERLRAALFRFIDETGGAIGALGEGLVASVTALVEGLGIGIGAIGFGIGAAGEAGLDGLIATGDASASLAQSTAEAAQDGVDSLTQQFQEGWTHGASQWATAGEGAKTTLDDAATALKEAVRTSWQEIQATLSSWFGQSASETATDRALLDDALPAADGLLEDALGILS